MRYRSVLTSLGLAWAAPLQLAAQVAPARTLDTSSTLIMPARVFDGMEMHDGWSVLVRGDRIAAAGPAGTINAPASARRIDLPGTTLMPGMIEMHSHLLLHPYNEATWDDQVLREPLALRVARATNHARETLRAGPGPELLAGHDENDGGGGLLGLRREGAHE